MSHADDVREYCRTHYILPARAAGAPTVTIRAGDVHAALSFTNRVPLVCSAIGAHAFEKMCRLERINIEGPLTGANTIFTFRLV